MVDPLDGTREFVAGIPEFRVSIAMVENGRPIAEWESVTRPPTSLSSLDTRDRDQWQSLHSRANELPLDGATVLASRSETKRGEWKQFEGANFKVRPMGSVAYKLALVSAGLVDITFTLVPKNEWDVAAGVALVNAGGGFVSTLENGPLQCNRRDPLISGLIAHAVLTFSAPLLQLLGKPYAACGFRPLTEK